MAYVNNFVQIIPRKAIGTSIICSNGLFMEYARDGNLHISGKISMSCYGLWDDIFLRLFGKIGMSIRTNTSARFLPENTLFFRAASTSYRQCYKTVDHLGECYPGGIHHAGIPAV